MTDRDLFHCEGCDAELKEDLPSISIYRWDPEHQTNGLETMLCIQCWDDLCHGFS